jgi:hypothetical protein
MEGAVEIYMQELNELLSIHTNEFQLAGCLIIKGFYSIILDLKYWI